MKRVEFYDQSEKDIEIIQKHLDNKNQGVVHTVSDAVRWAVAERANIIRKGNEDGIHAD